MNRLDNTASGLLIVDKPAGLTSQQVVGRCRHLLGTRKVGHAASIVGMTVIGALVATYVRLGTTLEITAGDAVVKLQADVLDKLMPAFLPLLYTLAMYALIRKGWSPLRLIVITVVLGIVGKVAGFL